MKNLLSVLTNKWSTYRFRFVPWIAWNLESRKTRSVQAKDDKVVVDHQVAEQLKEWLGVLHVVARTATVLEEQSKTARVSMLEKFGFTIELKQSIITNAGLGVFVTQGKVSAGSLVALYPGTIYRLGEPLFFPSIANPFVFRCIDGIHIDGKRTGISKQIYKSCVYRDLRWPYFPADLSWLTNTFANPLNCGQFINNESKDFPCNVAYQELDLDLNEIPFEMRRYLPNIFYSHREMSYSENFLRIVALVATKDIPAGAELFSTYYTIVHK